MIDETENGNNALMVSGAHVNKRDAKCGASVEISGGEILMNGQSFKNKPTTAITVAMWVKLNKDEDNLSLFTVKQSLGGQGATYNLEIKDGKLHWSHKDERGNYVFDLLTTQRSTVPQGLWTHVAATYSSHTVHAKIYIDSQLIKSEPGAGTLSADWRGKVAIGADGNLPGYVDEFYIYDRALALNDVKDLTELCNLGAGKLSLLH